jgi:hypothetical protein
VTTHDPARANIRTMHASFVVIFVLIFVVFGLGAYETLAAVMNPGASIVAPLVAERTQLGLAPAPQDDRPVIAVHSPTQTYSLTMDPVRTAQPGERYVVKLEEGSWVLAFRQGDAEERVFWIAMDSRVGPSTEPDAVTQILTASAVIVGVLLLTFAIYYGLRYKFGRRRRRRPRRPVAPALAEPSTVPNGSGRVPTAP